MRKDLVKILILATALTSFSGTPKPAEKPFVPPAEIDIEIKGRGLRYDTLLEFYDKGQKVIVNYHTVVKWQDIFGNGKLHWTRGDYTIDGKQYSGDGKEIHH